MWSKIKERMTWRNVRWFIGVNLFGWLMQACLFALLTLCGLESLHAAVTAKVANWLVFFGQCVYKARA